MIKIDNTIVDIYIKEFSFNKVDDDINKAYEHTKNTCEVLKKHYPDEAKKIDDFIYNLGNQIKEIENYDNADFRFTNCGVDSNYNVWIKNNNDTFDYNKSFDDIVKAFEFLSEFLKDKPKNKDLYKNQDWTKYEAPF